ncbi:MAG: trehalose-phosphatase [Pseudomonadota bacterium]
MNPILDHPGVLRAFAGPQTLFAFDYDGTLAPIVDDPAQARMRDTTRLLLTRLAQRSPCIVITGRSRQDVRPLLEGVPLIEIVGNHGLEAAGLEPLRYAARVQSWQARLQPQLQAQTGVRIENKKFSLSVHYRQSADAEAAREAILAACAPLEGLRRVGGKCVVNLLPVEAAHKGAALLAAHARLGTRRVIFVGDDETDEDVFTLVLNDALLGIRVGLSTDSQARYGLRSQNEMEALLELLVV